MKEREAAAEAEFRAALTESMASRTSISEVDLAYLSLVSRELEERVNQYRRECLPESPHLDDVGIAEDREKEWVELKDYLRRGLNGK